MVSQIRNIRFDVVSIKKKLLALEKAIFRRILHQPESLMLFLKKSIVAPLLKNLFLPLLSRYRILLANIRFLMETLNRSFHCGRNTSYHESTGSQWQILQLTFIVKKEKIPLWCEDNMIEKLHWSPPCTWVGWCWGWWAAWWSSQRAGRWPAARYGSELPLGSRGRRFLAVLSSPRTLYTISADRVADYYFRVF